MTLESDPGMRPGERKTVSEAFLEASLPESGVRHHVGFIVAAVAVHAALFLVVLPETLHEIPAAEHSQRVLKLRRLVLAPPKPPVADREDRPITERLPIPVPVAPETDDDPLVTFEAPSAPDLPSQDVVLLVDFGEPPPEVGPLTPGREGVTVPVRISMIEPRYPELARRARIDGRVVLRAVISRDGTVREVEVLEEPASNLGFAEAARKAVLEWRYRPATQNGRPVDVYFTVGVNFSLD